MIKKINSPELLTNIEIDEKYDGLYVAIQQTDELFSEGLGYVVAVGEKTDEIFTEMTNYISFLFKSTGMCGTIRIGDKNRDGEKLYVIFRNVR